MIKVKGMRINFGGKKNCRQLGAIKAQQPVSEGKNQLLNSWNKIMSPTVFYT